MNPIKIILADDNEDSIEIIKYFIRDLSDFDIVGYCHNGDKLVEEVMLKKPDLVLTDINMPMKNGMQAIKECLSFSPQMKFIFITGYDEYAVKAFEIAAVDYIVKPLEKVRLYQALEKTKVIISFEQEKTEPPIEELNMNILPLRDQHTIQFIPLTNIYFIEKAGKKCLVYTKTEIYETNETMAKIFTRLDDSFFQSHRSYIINLNEISQITPQNETFIVYFKDFDKQASISKLKINEVRERISLNQL
jgi:two-component system, LytTR family, response regulator